MSAGAMPTYVIKILAALEMAGYEAYAVGGCVRDTVIGRKPNDWDITTTAKPDEVERLFKRTAATGIKYGTVTVFHGAGKAEVTTFRADGEYMDGRRPETVEFVSALSEDLSRRDFTINAMAMDRQGAITDLFGGHEDIDKKLIRCVGVPTKRFNEDALRMFRAIRFSSQLGFDIDPETMTAIAANANLAGKISPERVKDELCKMLLSPNAGITAKCIETGLLEPFGILKGTAEITSVEKVKKDVHTRLTAFFVICMKNGLIKNCEEVLNILRFDGKTAEICKKAVNIHLEKADWTKLGIKRMIYRFGKDAALAAAGAEAAFSHCRIKDVNAVLKSNEPTDLSQLCITGDDMLALGYEGREIGKRLKTAMEYVLENPDKNNRTDLLKYISKI